MPYEQHDARPGGPGLDDSGHRGQVFGLGRQTLLLAEARLRYTEHPPPSGVAGLLVCTWSSAVDPAPADPPDDVRGCRLRTIPDGCVEISRGSDGRALVYGPSTTWSDLTLAPGQRFLGARLRAGAAAAMLRLAVDDLRGAVVDVADIPAIASLARVAPGSWHRHLGCLAERARADYLLDPVARWATRLLDRHPTVSVPQLAGLIEVSERQLRRRFTRAVGLPPVAYRRVARLRAAMTAALDAPAPSLAAIAADHGFADQAHLARQAVELTGLAPTALLHRRARGDRRPGARLSRRERLRGL